MPKCSKRASLLIPSETHANDCDESSPQAGRDNGVGTAAVAATLTKRINCALIQSVCLTRMRQGERERFHQPCISQVKRN